MKQAKDIHKNIIFIKESEELSIRKGLQGILEDFRSDGSASISIVKLGAVPRFLELCQKVHSPDIQDCAAGCLAILSRGY